MIKVAVVGYGYWGPNLLRNLNNQDAFEVTYLVEKRADRIAAAQGVYPKLKGSEDLANILSEIDAVVIATPVFTHFELAKLALENGVHVLLEKPMTSSVEESKTLINLSKEKGLALMVDHTFLYTGAVRKMKDLVDSGSIGDINYVDSTRINLGLFQPDVNVLWDLAPHDISIVNYLLGEDPISVQATGISHTNNEIENIAYLTINYPDNKIVHFNCSWSSPVKIRQMLIGGSKKMILFNDMEPTEKIKVYDTGFEVKSDQDRERILVDYRVGDIYVPKLDTLEALAAVVRDFADAIENKTRPVSDYLSGLHVIKVLEASSQSLKNNGMEIKI